jgi:hypothetical protein
MKRPPIVRLKRENRSTSGVPAVSAPRKSQGLSRWRALGRDQFPALVESRHRAMPPSKKEDL